MVPPLSELQNVPLSPLPRSCEQPAIPSLCFLCRAVCKWASTAPRLPHSPRAGGYALGRLRALLQFRCSRRVYPSRPPLRSLGERPPEHAQRPWTAASTAGSTPTPIPPLLRARMAVLCVLCGFLSFGTVTLCCAHGCRLKPLRKRSALCVLFKLRCAHAVKKIIQAHLLCAVNPLPRRVDLAVRLHSRHNCAGCHVHLARLFDDPLQGRPDVALASLEQSKRVRVPVDAGSVRQPEFLSNGCRRPPANEGTFDFLSLRMSADGAIPLVPSKASRRCEPSQSRHVTAWEMPRFTSNGAECDGCYGSETRNKSGTVDSSCINLSR